MPLFSSLTQTLRASPTAPLQACGNSPMCGSAGSLTLLSLSVVESAPEPALLNDVALRPPDSVKTSGIIGIKPIDEAKGVGADLRRCPQFKPLDEVGGDEHAVCSARVSSEIDLNCIGGVKRRGNRERWNHERLLGSEGRTGKCRINGLNAPVIGAPVQPRDRCLRGMAGVAVVHNPPRSVKGGCSGQDIFTARSCSDAQIVCQPTCTGLSVECRCPCQTNVSIHCAHDEIGWRERRRICR